jgi:TPR repeat protein
MAQAQKLTDQARREQQAEEHKSPNIKRREQAAANYQRAMQLFQAGDYVVAAALFELSANQGNRDAQIMTARLYEDGTKGLPLDEGKAQYWRLRLYDRLLPDHDITGQGHFEAEDLGGIEYLCGGQPLYTDSTAIPDPERGLQLLNELTQFSAIGAIPWASHENRVRVTFLKYQCYSRTQNPDPKVAEKYLSEAGTVWNNQSRDNSKNVLYLPRVKEEAKRCANCYQTPPSFKLYDHQSAITRYESAADAGDTKAQIALYEAYSDGRGAPQDREAAWKWIMRAAEQEDGFAAAIVGDAYLHGYAPVVQDFRSALTWLTKGAERGSWIAAYQLAQMYDQGLGVPQDDKRSREWLARCSVLAGDSDMAANLCPGIGQSRETGSALQRAFQQ